MASGAVNTFASFSSKKTKQTDPIPCETQVINSASGCVYAVDDWVRLTRMLVTGVEGGTYYINQPALLKDNAEAVLRCIKEDGVRVVNTIVEISNQGRAAKNDPAIFSLALACSFGGQTGKRAAFEALPKVCRTATHLYHFMTYVHQFRGWGRGLRDALANWLNSKSVSQLAYQSIKYGQRDGWSLRDVLRIAHPKTTDPSRQRLYHWITKGWETVGDEPHDDPNLSKVWAAEKAKREDSVQRVVDLTLTYGLPREAVPTTFLDDPDIWDALVTVDMPITALLRNVATLTRVGTITPMDRPPRAKILDRIMNREVLAKGRVHPISVLSALKVYAQGHGERSSKTWTPVQQVIDALDSSFYMTFKDVVPTNKRLMIALDVSGSMYGNPVNGIPGLDAATVAAAMALVTANIEPNYTIMGFSHELVPVPISPHQRLDDVIKVMMKIPFGRTDCSLPMVHALEKKIPVDAFLVFTDSETFAGGIHPMQALRQYREKMGIPAKLVVAAVCSNGFTIADPNDAGAFDLCGFDSAAPSLISEFLRR